MSKKNKTACGFCGQENKTVCSCSKACFCRGGFCQNSKIKICAKCGAEYLALYDDCPSCAVSNK